MCIFADLSQVGSSGKQQGSVSLEIKWGLWREKIDFEWKAEKDNLDKGVIMFSAIHHPFNYPSINPAECWGIMCRKCVKHCLTSLDSVANKIQCHHNLKIPYMDYGRGWWPRTAKFWNLEEYSSYLPIFPRKSKKFRPFYRDNVICGFKNNQFFFFGFTQTLFIYISESLTVCNGCPPGGQYGTAEQQGAYHSKGKLRQPVGHLCFP